MILQKKIFLKNVAIYIMNTIKIKKSFVNSVLLQKLTWFGHIYHKIWEYFSLGKCKHKRKKEKKFSRSQENEDRRVIFFVKMLLFIQRTERKLKIEDYKIKHSKK